MAKERSHKITLSYPIEWEGGSASEIILQRPKVRILKEIDQAVSGAENDFDAGIITISILSGLPVEAIDDLDVDDFEKISEVVDGFFPQGKAPPNGGLSSPKPHTS